MEIKNRAELFSIAEKSALTAGHKYNNITSVIFSDAGKEFQINYKEQDVSTNAIFTTLIIKKKQLKESS